MIVKITTKNGYRTIGDVEQIETGFYDIELAIDRYNDKTAEKILIKLCEGNSYYRKMVNTDGLFHMLLNEFSGDETIQCIPENYIILEENKDYKKFAIVIKVKTSHGENVCVANYPIYLMNDKGETIERIN